MHFDQQPPISPHLPHSQATTTLLPGPRMRLLSTPRISEATQELSVPGLFHLAHRPPLSSTQQMARRPFP